MSDPAVNKTRWTRVAFGEVVRKVSDRIDPETSGLERYVAGEHMDTDDLRIRRWGIIGDGYLGPAFHIRFKPGQVLYGSRRTYLRKVAVPDFEGITANTTFVLEPKDRNVLLPELLPFIMQAEPFHEHSIKQSKGSVNPYVNFSDLAWYEFALPPLDAQRRIAEMLQSCWVGCQAYHTAAARCGQVLTVAIETRLDGVHNRVTVSDLVETQVIASPQDGNHGEKHPKASDYVERGIPFLMAADLCDGQVDLLECKFVTKEQAESLRVGFALPGDVLLTHKGTLGETAILPLIDYPFVMLTPQVTYYRVIDPERLLPKFLYYVFRSREFRREMAALGRQSTRQFVGITAQRRLHIPLPSPDTQAKFVHEWSALDSGRALAEGRTQETMALQKKLGHHLLNGAWT